MSYTLNFFKQYSLHLKRVRMTLKSFKKNFTSNALHSQIIQIRSLQFKCTVYSQKNLSKFKPLKLCVIGVKTPPNLSNKSLNTQVFQIICYWSLNTFKALKETFKRSKHSKSNALKSKHLQTSQISLSTLKSLKSCIIRI